MTDPDWKPVIYLPTNLTVRFGSEVLTADDPSPWCEQKAAELLGDVSRKKVRPLTECLEEYAANFRTDPRPTCAALFFYPDFTRMPPRAVAKVYVVGEDPVVGPMTLTRAREIHEPDKDSFGETEMTETEVPAGPALRVRRFRKENPDKKRSAIVEQISWVICPPGSTQALMINTLCAEPAFRKVAAEITDDMAKNFRTEPPKA